jgi:uncharacterized protein YciI
VVRDDRQGRARRARETQARACGAIDSPDPGPAGFLGSLIIAEFASLADARAWLEADPYVTTGVFESWDVRPFVKVLP